FSERGSLIMGGPEENTQFVFIDYEVIGDTEKPAFVENLTATNMNTTGEVALDWSYSSDNVGVVKYKVYANQSGTNISDVSSLLPVRIVGSSTNSTIISKLTNDVQYCFAVTAIDSEGNENKTIISTYCATPTAETTAPTVTQLLPENGSLINDSNKDEVSTLFNLSVSDGTLGPGVSGLSHYEFEISNSSDFNTSCTVNYTVKEPYLNVYLWDNIYMDLCGNGTYHWRATVYDHAGNSNLSEVWNFTLNITATEILFEDATFYPSDMPEDDVFLVNVTNLGAAINLSVYDLYILGNGVTEEPLLYGIGENETLTYVVNGTSEPMFKEEHCSEGFEIGIVNRTDPGDYLAYRQMELNCV
ncbi:MAG: fibronectin type III domain-containing protein, partial [Candidatus Aenigmarchaeota archaeon]|nr:fibronectin type III domain-containing protein [Candidatus Aenigmarchaeota archaeon]